MQRSDSIAELAKALCAAQAEIEGVVKDKENGHFRSKYADLGAVWEAVRAPLTKHGLSVVQFPRACDLGVEVETTLFHTSGEYLSDTFALPVSKRDAHGYGSAVTYARRFSLMAAVGIAPVDDDGNESTKGGTEPMGTGKHRDDIGAKDAWEDWAKGGPQSECAEWLTKAKNELRMLVSTEDVNKWAKLAAQAKKIKALHDHHPARYDWLMGKINERIDELRAKEAA